MEFSKLHLNVDNRAEVLVLTQKLKPFVHLLMLIQLLSDVNRNTGSLFYWCFIFICLVLVNEGLILY